MGILVFHYYGAALERAKKDGKPLLVEFTCYGCESGVTHKFWTQSTKELLSDSFVVARLHVDDRQELPESEREHDVNTYGELWYRLERERFGRMSQPYFVILDAREEPLNGGAAYPTHHTPGEFRTWLEEGLRRYAR